MDGREWLQHKKSGGRDFHARVDLRARRESTVSQREIGWDKERPCERHQVRARNCTREGRAAWKGSSNAAQIQQPNVGVG